ncbi:sterol desaturase family protein [Aspergillus undulatus]|uniref:sterol desaturase family protein n=1 Tax=Aspergillus undulatus TaxID=1810928 RepID=UPI003CCD03A9
MAKHILPLFLETIIIAATQLTVYIGYAIYESFYRKEKIQKFLQLAAVHTAVTAIGGIGLTTLIGHPKDAPPLQKSLSRISTSPPPLTEIITHYITAVLTFDFIFYTLHRLMHTKPLYTAIHSTHHSFPHTRPSPFAVVHAHPLDYLLTQSLPVMTVVRILDAHWLTMVVVGATGLLAAMYVHSADLAGVMSHLGHHRRPKENFGALGVADAFAGWVGVGVKGSV